MAVPKIKNWFYQGCLLVMGLAYYLLAYHTPRTAFGQLLVLYTLLFAGYAYCVYFFSQSPVERHGWGAALLYRLLLFAAVPALSDDYFRFIWDGKLLMHGINPYDVMPAAFMQSPLAAQLGFTPALYQGLNSPHYYTVYPPVMQGVFLMAVWITGANVLGSVMVLRGVILLAELGNIWLLSKLLERAGLPKHRVLLYALNPLVIIELTGNLHFEALMLFFLLLSIYFLGKQRYILSAIAFALAVDTKLIPLLFLPLFLKRMHIKQALLFGLLAMAGALFLFLPFLDTELWQHLGSSMDLYWQKFEFNASIYYLVRAVGYALVGYNIIHWSGPWMTLLSGLIILYISYRTPAGDEQKGWLALLWISMIYLLLASTVHPWYMVPLIAFCLFTPYRFPIIWSALIILSYHAYIRVPVTEQWGVVALEYFVVLVYVVCEWRWLRMNNEHQFVS